MADAFTRFIAKLTAPQRAALLDLSAYRDPNTSRALKRKGLINRRAPTELGRGVIAILKTMERQ